MDLAGKIRNIQDFPKKGIIFRDITTLLKDPQGLHEAVDQIQKLIGDLDFDVIAAPESRGFLFGMPVAYNMKKGFVPLRKPGKLPAEVYCQSYTLEYGTEEIEMHKDAIQPGQKVVVIDDLLATGGTAKAIGDLVQQAGGQVVKYIFLIELDGLGGRDCLKDYPVAAVLSYEEK